MLKKLFIFQVKNPTQQRSTEIFKLMTTYENRLKALQHKNEYVFADAQLGFIDSACSVISKFIKFTSDETEKAWNETYRMQADFKPWLDEKLNDLVNFEPGLVKLPE